MKNMQRFLTLSAALLLCLGARAQSGFQAKPVYVSNLADTVLGKVYLVHQVGEGHTLYSIGRAYKTSFDKMLKDSPDNQVDIDEYIYIPYQEGMLPEGTVLQKFTGKKPWVVFYLERSGEPEAVSFPPTSTVSDQPVQNEAQSGAPAEARPETVTPPSNAAIEAASQDIPESERPSVTEMGEDAAEPASDSISVIIEDGLQETKSVPAQLVEKEPKDILDIALMLPLYGNRPDDRRAYVYLPFFEGASIAWTEKQNPDYFASPDTSRDAESEPMPLPETGTTSQAPGFRLKLYDLTLIPNALQEILNDPALAEADAVMAAAFANQFPLLDDYCAEHQIPLIHPLSERDSLGVSNPWFVQLCAPHQTQLASVAAFALNRYAHHKILIISDTNESERQKAEYLQFMLPQAEYRIFDANLEKDLESYSDEDLTEKTLIIPFYAKEITAVKTMLALRQSKNVTLLAPSVWLDYPTIELNYFLQNNLCVYSAFGRSMHTATFKEFALHYYLVYKGMPNRMAYQGYLSLKWLMNRLTADNTNFLLRTPADPAGDAYYPTPRQDMAGFENAMVRFLQLTASGLEPIEF